MYVIADGLFGGGIFDDTPMPEVAPVEGPSGSSLDVDGCSKPPPSAGAAPSGACSTHDSDDDMDHFGGAPSPMDGHSSDNDSRPPSALGGPILPEPSSVTNDAAGSTAMTPVHEPPQESNLNLASEEATQNGADGPANEQTTLLNNEDESFALAPVDASVLKGIVFY